MASEQHRALEAAVTRAASTHAGSVAPAHRLFTDAILLQPPIERAAAHAELLRRQADVAAVARQDLFDEDALGILERLRVGARRCRRCRAAAGCRCRAVDRRAPPDPPSAPRARRCARARARCRASGAPASASSACGVEAGERLAIARRVVRQEVRGERRRCPRAVRAAAAGGSRRCSADRAGPRGSVRRRFPP